MKRDSRALGRLAEQLETLARQVRLTGPREDHADRAEDLAAKLRPHAEDAP